MFQVFVFWRFSKNISTGRTATFFFFFQLFDLTNFTNLFVRITLLDHRDNARLHFLPCVCFLGIFLRRKKGSKNVTETSRGLHLHKNSSVSKGRCCLEFLYVTNEYPTESLHTISLSAYSYRCPYLCLCATDGTTLSYRLSVTGLKQNNYVLFFTYSKKKCQQIPSRLWICHTPFVAQKEKQKHVKVTPNLCFRVLKAMEG